MKINIKTRKKEASKVTILGIIANIFLTILKLFAGIFGASSAMIADAAHSFSDLITDAVLIVGVYLGAKPADKDHPYGHGRFETFATMIIALILLFVAIGIFINGLKAVYNALQGNIIQAPRYIALIMAAISILVKELMYQYTAFVGKKIKSTAVVSNAWHHRSDALSSVATFLGISGAIFLGESWRILDPIAAMLVSILIFAVGFKIIKNSCSELMDKALPKEDVETIKKLCLTVKGVKNPHDIKTRKVGFRLSVDLHININKQTSFTKVHTITNTIENKIKKHFGKSTFVCIHPEPI